MPAVTEWTTSTAVTVDKLNESGHIRSVIYNAGASRLEVTVGPVQADFTWPGRTSNVVTITTTTVVNIASPAINTTYYVFLQAAGTFRTSTSPIILPDEVRLGSVATGATLPTLTRADLRGMLPIPMGAMFPIGNPQVLVGAASSFPSVTIPAGVFNSLMIIGEAQGSSGGINTGYRFNADSAANYGLMQEYNTTGTVVGGTSTVWTFIQAGLASSGSSGVWVSLISGLKYTSHTNRPVITAASSAGAVLLRAAYWNQSAAITAVQVVADANMMIDSSVQIFGIR